MAVSFFPFNSIVVNGVADRAANAENLAAYLAGFFSDGVIMQANTALQVAVDSGMKLQILAGTGNIKGKTILNTTAASITIEAANATLKRIDRVIFRLDENNRLMEFDVLKGTAASSPTAPVLTRSGGIYEMCLAEVLVPAGATSILASYITDTRSDSSKCGVASIPPHMQDIAHGGTGATTAAGAWGNLVKEYDKNGWHIKEYPNGYCELRYKQTLVVASTGWGAWGAIYTKDLAAVSYPVNFESIPHQSVELQTQSNSGWLDIGNNTISDTGHHQFNRANSGASFNATIVYTVYGKLGE